MSNVQFVRVKHFLNVKKKRTVRINYTIILNEHNSLELF